MAGFLDFFSTLNLTPEELKQLQLSQKGGALQGALEGEYQPRAEGISQDRPRIGADPVSTQEQSRVGPDRSGRTFYANTAGDVGTSIPKGSGTSGVYSAAEEAVGTGGRGLLGTVGRAAGKLLGPVGVALDFVNPDEVGNGELTPEQQAQQAQLAMANMGPQMAGDAWQFGQDVAQRTLNAGLGRGNPIDLRDPQAPRSNLFDQSRSPREPALEQSPVGPVAEAQPQNAPQAVAAATQQRAAAQQAIADQSLEALNTGKMTRTQAAQAVVQADVARSGKELTPDQQEAAVKEEVANMKGMDNKGLSKYLGIALVAGGLLASVLDKSGRTAGLFADSMNKQMDRELQLNMFGRKQDAAAAKAQQEMMIDLLKVRQGDVRNQIYQQATDQTGEYNTARVRQGDERNQLTAQGQAAQNAYRGASLNLRQQGLLQNQQQFEASQALRERQLAATEANTASLIKSREEQAINDRTSLMIRAKAVKAQEQGQLPKLSTKDAEALVGSVIEEAQGVKLGKDAKSAMAQQARRMAQQDPTFWDNPAAAVQRLQDQPVYEEGGRGPIGLLWGVPSTQISVKKRITK